MRDRVVLFDFDGTLIRSNSFPRWIRFLLVSTLTHGRITAFAQISRLIVMRKVLGRLSHEDFKVALLRLEYPTNWDDRFMNRLFRDANQAVVQRLSDHLNSGDVVLISSAAPMRYLNRLPDRLPAGQLHIIGSCLANNVLKDNFRELKATNLLTSGHLGAEGLLDAVYTDSSDDIACARLAAQTILVRPSAQSLKIFMDDRDLRGRVSLFDGS